MPKKVKGYNEEGGSQWFIGSLPEGWSKKPPVKEEAPKRPGRPPKDEMDGKLK